MNRTLRNRIIKLAEEAKSIKDGDNVRQAFVNEVSRILDAVKSIREDHQLGESKHPLWGLSTRAANCCINLGLSSRKQVLDAVKTGRLYPRKSGCRNCGWLTYAEINKWLRFNEPTNR